MVDLESLEDPAEVDLVQTLIMKHAAATGSTHAQRLLNDWGALQQKLVKIMPREYKRALAEQARKVATADVAVVAVVAASGQAARAAHG